MEPGTWHPYYNWTREQFDRTIHEVLVEAKQTAVGLDVEHSDRQNMDDIMRWAKEAGYNAEEINCDIIIIRKE